MFTLNFPIRLPAEHTFFENGQYPVPPLPGGLSFGCFSYENEPSLHQMPLLLHIMGFVTEQEALDFCPILRNAIRVASLDSEHSITPSAAAPVTSNEMHFDGSVPTVTPTQIKALPYYTSASMRKGQHISVLSKRIGVALAQRTAAKVNEKPELALALELYSDCQFAGELSAQFIVLMTALEIMVPTTSSKGKRGAVVALVKDALSTAGHADSKAAGKKLDCLYVARNALVHEAKPVTDAELKALKEIVRSTLKALA